jgi:DNA-directed RNA polymerase specialized sigma24 family protein
MIEMTGALTDSYPIPETPAVTAGIATKSPNNPPDAARAVEEARVRLSEELERWPPVQSPLLWALLRNRSLPPPTCGAQVHFIRAATERGERRVARELFVLLLEQVEAACAGWARRCVLRTPGVSYIERSLLQEELRQELALRLWDQIAVQHAPAWELFFHQSLIFAGRHTATAVMQQRGYWPARAAEQLPEAAAWCLPDNGASPFTGADLADLRRLVQQLPARLRAAIWLRYWHDATEGEIASLLGGISTRTVRNYLRQGYTLLRRWYGESEAMVP